MLWINKVSHCLSHRRPSKVEVFRVVQNRIVPTSYGKNRVTGTRTLEEPPYLKIDTFMYIRYLRGV